MTMKSAVVAIALVVVSAPAAYAYAGPAPENAYLDNAATYPVVAPPFLFSQQATINPVSAPAVSEFAFHMPGIKVTLPPPPPPPPPPTERSAVKSAPASQRAATSSGYKFHVPLTGHQGAIDRCDGFVWEDFGSRGNTVSAHNYCGGAVILKLDVGDTVRLTGYGEGTYTVTRIKSVPKGSSSSVLDGKLWMQTCYFNKSDIRLVQLTKAS
jgi:hypothetical protein